MENLKSQQKSNLLLSVPTPIAGLMLALASAGNMMKPRSDILRIIFGFIALIIFIILIMKVIKNFKTIKEEFNNVAIGSVMPTFSMGTMVLSTYIFKFSPTIATTLWYAGVILHIIFIILFTIKYVIGFKIEKVLPSWYIVYVGIVVATVTGKMFNQTIGKISFYFGFTAYIILIAFVITRVYKIKNMKKPEIPSKAIMAAPGSLCLAGYLSGIEDKNSAIIIFLLIISQLFFIIVLAELPKILKGGFYPSFSALTFPMVISAQSMKAYAKYLTAIGKENIIFSYISNFQEILALALCIYVLYKYIIFIKQKVYS